MSDKNEKGSVDPMLVACCCGMLLGLLALVLDFVNLQMAITALSGALVFAVIFYIFWVAQILKARKERQGGT